MKIKYKNKEYFLTDWLVNLFDKLEVKFDKKIDKYYKKKVTELKPEKPLIRSYVEETEKITKVEEEPIRKMKEYYDTTRKWGDYPITGKNIKMVGGSYNDEEIWFDKLDNGYLENIMLPKKVNNNGNPDDYDIKITEHYKLKKTYADTLNYYVNMDEVELEYHFTKPEKPTSRKVYGW